MKFQFGTIALLSLCLTSSAENTPNPNPEWHTPSINSTTATEIMTAQNNKKRVASDNAQKQNTNKKIATRVLKGGTKIKIHFGNVVIPGTLNDSETAKALIAKLPLKVSVNRYAHDFCGILDQALPYKEDAVHYGWLNGDIDFATDSNYFTILFEDEEKSEQYGYQVNIGKIDGELSEIAKLRGHYTILIELAN